MSCDGVVHVQITRDIYDREKNLQCWLSVSMQMSGTGWCADFLHATYNIYGGISGCMSCDCMTHLQNHKRYIHEREPPAQIVNVNCQERGGMQNVYMLHITLMD